VTARSALTRSLSRARAAALRIRGLWARGGAEARMDEEMRFHLDHLADHIEKSGLPRAEAMRLARIEFGGVERQREASRDALRMRPLDDFAQDLRFGARSLARTPVITLATVLTLAVGIGGTTALFGLLDRLAFRTLAVPHPDRLFSLVGERPRDISESVPYPLYVELSRASALGITGGYAFRTATLGEGGDAKDSAIVQLSTANWFATVGVAPFAGRLWSRDADVQQAVISDAFWRRRFARSTNAIGTTLPLDGHLFRIIGVMRPGFTGVSLDFPVDVWLPIEAEPQFDGTSQLNDPARNWVRVLARLDASTRVASATSAANVVLARARAARLATVDSAERMALSSAAQPSTHDRAQVARILVLALALAALVLLIACANIANLQLARSAGRSREIAVRLSLGAGRGRLIRQLLTESLILATLGAAAGLWLAFLASQFLAVFAATQGIGTTIGSLTEGIVSGGTLVFTATVAVASALIFGLAPAMRSSRVDVTQALRQTGVAARTRGEQRGLNSLLVVQLALSVVLLISALTASASLRAALSVDLGFDARHVLRVSIDWRGVGDAQARADAQAVASALRATPGVADASVSYPAVFGRSTATTSMRPVSDNAQAPSPASVEYQIVSPEFFATTQVKVEQGRVFTNDDRAGGELVAILNQTAARQLSPGQNPVGARFTLFGSGRVVRVVGVARDARLHSPTASPPPLVYVPFAQDPEGAAPSSLLSVEARTGDVTPSSTEIARRIAFVDPRLKADVQPVAGLVRESLVVERLSAWTTGAFGVLGVLLAILGVYGLHSFVVSRRTTELGVRLALGATQGRVLWEVWREGMRPVVIGAVAGVLISGASTGLLGRRMLGLSLVDVKVAAMSAALLAAIAAVACFIPARSAAKLDPVRALRAD
jgi:predicted permease